MTAPTSGTTRRTTVRYTTMRDSTSEHPIEFESLGALLTTLAAAFERGVYFVDPIGYLEMDDLEFGELAAQLNPDVDWWRD